MKHFWWSEWKPEPPYRGKRTILTGSETELQEIINKISTIFPDILSSGKKLNKSKLQKYQYELQVLENKKDRIIELLEEVQTAEEQKLESESNDTQKTLLENKITGIKELLEDISGFTLKTNWRTNCFFWLWRFWRRLFGWR